MSQCDILWQLSRTATICSHRQEISDEVSSRAGGWCRQLGGTEGQATVPQNLRDRQFRGKHHRTESAGR
jgi:hypothetical protein